MHDATIDVADAVAEIRDPSVSAEYDGDFMLISVDSITVSIAARTFITRLCLGASDARCAKYLERYRCVPSLASLIGKSESSEFKIRAATGES